MTSMQATDGLGVDSQRVRVRGMHCHECNWYYTDLTSCDLRLLLSSRFQNIWITREKQFVGIDCQSGGGEWSNMGA